MDKKSFSIFDDIATAFKNAMDENLKQFLEAIENKANVYMYNLSSEDFHGIVRLIYDADGNVGIKLYGSNDIEIKNSSGSQETIKYISVLFAISDLMQESRDESYKHYQNELITDAYM